MCGVGADDRCGLSRGFVAVWEKMLSPETSPPQQDPQQHWNITMTLKIHFQGGLELLFNNESEMSFEMPSSPSPYTLTDLIVALSQKVTKQKELFLDTQRGDTVRPGVLVLVNDTDWDLLDAEKYEVQDGDEIVFISTLHGG